MNRDIFFEEHSYEPVQPGTPPIAVKGAPSRVSSGRN